MCAPTFYSVYLKITFATKSLPLILAIIQTLFAGGHLAAIAAAKGTTTLNKFIAGQNIYS
jgi:hypothetical protein